jgi:hypothetical protein
VVVTPRPDQLEHREAHLALPTRLARDYGHSHRLDFHFTGEYLRNYLSK